MSFDQALRLLLIVTGMIVADCASAAQRAAIDQCRLYGFAPHSRDYALCRMNVRRCWTTGPCGNSDFAAMHRGYCHLNPPPFI
jgi:hypothetical protein